MRARFFVVGAPKAGTTALARVLRQHPGLFLTAIKEPHHYTVVGPPRFRGPGDARTNAATVTDPRAYEALFATAGSRLPGEASATYLMSPVAPARIRADVPDARILVVLRDPAERAWSAFLHLVREGRETTRDFGEALRLESARTASGWHYLWRYVAAGRYHSQLQNWYAHFPSAQVHVLLDTDLAHDLVGTARGIHRFLGVDPGVVPVLPARVNPSGMPRSRVGHRLYRAVRAPFPGKRQLLRLLPLGLRDRLLDGLQARLFVRPPLDAALRAALVAEFEVEIRGVEALLGRDLTTWRCPAVESAAPSPVIR